jgi:N,N'-diacetyllegionaminate synthase
MKKNLIIAEIGSTHDGNLVLAKRSIKKAAKCGADIVKFQMHIPEEETLKNAPNPPYFKKENRYDYFKRTGFSFKQWKNLILECKKNNVEFLCSPFSLRAVDELEKLKVKSYKIASGELTNTPLLEKIYKTGKFVFISTGMSNFKEIDNALKIFKNKNKICLMQCTSMYPCKDKYIGLNVIDQFKKKYSVSVGFSDHSNDFIPSISAASLGCDFIEKHFTLSQKLYGSDAKFAMEPKKFKKYCKNI